MNIDNLHFIKNVAFINVGSMESHFKWVDELAFFFFFFLVTAFKISLKIPTIQSTVLSVEFSGFEYIHRVAQLLLPQFENMFIIWKRNSMPLSHRPLLSQLLSPPTLGKY